MSSPFCPSSSPLWTSKRPTQTLTKQGVFSQPQKSDSIVNLLHEGEICFSVISKIDLAFQIACPYCLCVLIVWDRGLQPTSIYSEFVYLADGWSMPLLVFPFPSRFLWNESRFYHYLWHALRSQEMKAKPDNSTLVNNFGENFEGERFWNIQNWVNQLEISEKPEQYYKGPYFWQLLSPSVCYLVSFPAFMQDAAGNW